jgi:hypothetical protein
MADGDAKGFGALEHNRYYRCFAWSDAEEELVNRWKMLFHEFNPIGIHSKEIQYFDYNMQKMSNIYGCTKELQSILLTYFKLTKDWLLRTNSIPEFQRRLKEQNNERQYVFHYHERQCIDTTIQRPVRKCLPKGALIGMCLDIIIREKNGEEEFLIWCKNSPMNMAFQNRLTWCCLFAKITAFYQVGAFLTTCFRNDTNSYDNYFQK